MTREDLKKGGGGDEKEKKTEHNKKKQSNIESAETQGEKPLT